MPKICWYSQTYSISRIEQARLPFYQSMKIFSFFRFRNLSGFWSLDFVRWFRCDIIENGFGTKRRIILKLRKHIKNKKIHFVQRLFSPILSRPMIVILNPPDPIFETKSKHFNVRNDYWMLVPNISNIPKAYRKFLSLKLSMNHHSSIWNFHGICCGCSSYGLVVTNSSYNMNHTANT